MVITQLTNYIEQSPSWKAKRFSASQEIPRILWNPKAHYSIHKSPTLVSVQSQIDPVHALPVDLKSILVLSSHLRLGLPSSISWLNSIRIYDKCVGI
jgi:hypothetical protein